MKHVLSLLVLALLTLGTIRRNHDWRSEVSIWQDAATKSPKAVRPQLNLGFALQKSGDVAGAVLQYRKVLDLCVRGDREGRVNGVRFCDGAASNLGSIYIDLKQYDQAAQLLAYSAENSPTMDASFINLGVIKLRQGQPREALEWFNRVREKTPEIEVNRGMAYAQLGFCAEAERHYSVARKWFPQAPLTCNPS